MRLICPNCDAQYEVADGAIADAGRDVQCSNCGHAWFQLPPDLEAEEELVGKPAPSATSMPPAKPAPEPAFEPEPEAEPEFKPAPEALPTNDNALDEAALAAALGAAQAAKAVPPPEPPQANAADAPSEDKAAPSQPVAAARKPLDDSLKAVLREEAEREAAVRRSQTPRPLETQPDLGLQDTTGAAKAVRDRLARLRGQEPEPEDTSKPTARRDLLPDIEEINSTLRASSENRSGDEAVMAAAEAHADAPNTGFRSGFSLMLLIAVVLIAAYVAAPKIIQQLPATEGAMNSYVTGVNAARVWLDNAMRNAIEALQNLTGGA
jgi:predicted Zn finger-like uncharacterized protein